MSTDRVPSRLGIYLYAVVAFLYLVITVAFWIAGEALFAGIWAVMTIAWVVITGMAVRTHRIQVETCRLIQQIRGWSS